MNIRAIDADTGKVLMTHAGSLSEQAFRNTVVSSFPDMDPDKLVIIVDGAIRSRTSGGPSPRPDDGGKSVIWRGSYLDAGGYALMNREIVLRLPHYGFQVKIDILNTAPQVGKATHGILKVLESVKVPNEKNCPLVIGFTPMPVRASGRRVIFYTMMETQSLHPEFVDRCNASANEIWVPGEFCRKLFQDSGVIRPVYVMPLGANDKTYTPEAKEPRLAYEAMPSGRITYDLPSKKRFISVFGWSYRKGPDVLCKSFLREFDDMDDACLVIYSRYMGSSAEVHKEHVRNEIRQYYEEEEGSADIFYCGDVVQAQDLPGCFAAADAFVLCSRGEGFALPIVEAGACGVPIIASYNTAMTDYLDDDVAYCVRPDGYAPANDKLCWISGYYRDQEFAVMEDEAISGFRSAMRQVVEEPDEAAVKAQRFREKVLSKYTWDACAERVAMRLDSED